MSAQQPGVRNINFGELVNRSKISELGFDETLKYILKFQKAIIELEDFGFATSSSGEESQNIVSMAQYLQKIANVLEVFDLKNSNSHQVKQDIDNDVSFILNNLFPRARSVLTYLREENVKSPTESESRKIIADLNKIKKEAEESLKKIEIDRKSAEAGRGIASAQVFAHKFSVEAKENKDLLDKWPYKWGMFSGGINWLFYIGVILIFSVFWYYGKLLKNNDVTPAMRFEFTVLAFTLFSLYFYLLRYILRLKNILMHHYKVNKHRANVAETVLSFYNSGVVDSDVKIKLLEHGVRVMFEPESTGYLVKDQMEMGSPMSPVSATLDISKVLAK